MWRLTCKMPIPSLFLSFSDVQATILVWSSWFLDSRCIMAQWLWQNFFVKIESAVFVYCHGNHPVFCVNYVFERCTGHNTDHVNGRAPRYVNHIYKEVLLKQTQVALWRSRLRRWLSNHRVVGSILTWDILWFNIFLILFYAIFF